MLDVEVQLSRVLEEPVAIPPVDVVRLRVVRRARRRRITVVGASAALATLAGLTVAISMGDDPDDVNVATAAPDLPTALPLDLPVPQAIWSREGVTGDAIFLPDAGVALRAHGSFVYVASGFFPEEGLVTALDTETGDTRWRQAIEGQGGDPSAWLQFATNTVVVANHHVGPVVGLAPDTGKELWRYAVEHSEPLGNRAYFVRAAVPVGGGDLLVALSGDGEGNVSPPRLERVSLSPPSRQWRVELDPGTDLEWGHPYVEGDLAVFQSRASHPGSGANVVHGIDLVSGEVRWRRELPGGQGVFVHDALLGEAGLVFARTTFGGVVALDEETGEQRWERAATVPLAVRRGIVYAAEGLRVVGLDAGTGAPVTAMQIGETAQAGLVIGDALIIATPTAVLGVDLTTGVPMGRWATRVAKVEGGPSPTRVIGVLGMAPVGGGAATRVAVATDDRSITVLEFR